MVESERLLLNVAVSGIECSLLLCVAIYLCEINGVEEMDSALSLAAQ